MPTTPTPPGRRWQLLAYDHDKKLVHDETVANDELDAALRELEHNPKIGRIKAVGK